MESRIKPVRLHHELCIPSKCDPQLHPIIFVHGLADTGNTWKNVVQKIAEQTKRKAYVIDIRNHGKSEWSDTHNVYAMCADLEHFIVQNGIQKSVLVTHSIGGRVGMLLALRKPELVEKIVLEEARLMNVTPKEYANLDNLSRSLRLITLLSKTMSEKEIRAMMAKKARQLFPDSDVYEAAVYNVPGYQDVDGTFRLGFNHEALNASVKDKSLWDIQLDGYEKFTGPALVIYATKSEVEVEKDEVLPEYFPNVEMCRFEKQGHVLHRECEVEFAAKVSDFINK